jgi:ABC-type nitrate/sulfonate/bicarbonate transport system substrate-binding protein
MKGKEMKGSRSTFSPVVRVRLAVVLLLAAVGAVLAFAIPSVAGVRSSLDSPPASCPTVTKLNIATSPYQDTLIMWLGQKEGWYKQACLNVSFTNTSWSSILSVLSSGTANMAWYNTTGVVATYHQDPRLVYLYPFNIFDQGAAMMARPSAHLTSYAQFRAKGLSSDKAIKAVVNELKGKTVIIAENQDTGEDLTMLLRRQHKPSNWVKTINLGQAPGLAAFLRGTGDAYIGGIPQRQTLINAKYQTLLAGSDLTPPPLNGFVTTRGFWNANKPAILSLMHVMFMNIRYTQAHTASVGSYISHLYDSQTGGSLTQANFVDFFQHWEHYPLNAAQAQAFELSPHGYAYWKTIWKEDNTYLVDLTKSVPSGAPTSAFLGKEFQKLYVKKYGAKETGWWPPTG